MRYFQRLGYGRRLGGSCVIRACRCVLHNLQWSPLIIRIRSLIIHPNRVLMIQAPILLVQYRDSKELIPFMYTGPRSQNVKVFSFY